MTHTDNIRALLAQINAECTAIDNEANTPPPSTWYHTLNGNAPFYEADFVAGKYYAAGAERTSLANFMTAAGLTGNTYVGTTGLLFGSGTNLVWPSNDFTSTNWIKGAINITANSTIGSDGAQTATCLAETSANDFHQLYALTNITAGSTYTASMEVKAGTRTKGRIWFNKQATGFYADFDLATGTIGPATNFGGSTPVASSITSLGNGWYRVSVSGICGSQTTANIILAIRDNTGAVTYTGASGTMYASKAQVELGSVATVYQATVVASPASGSLLTSTITAPTAITRIIKAKTAAYLPSDLYQVLEHLDNNTNTTNGYSDLEVYRDTNSHVILELKKLSTSLLSGQIDFGVIPNNTEFKLAYTASPSGLAASINGGPVLTSNVVAWPTDLTVNRLNGNIMGSRLWGGSLALDAVFFDTATSSQLQTLSL